jgi:hypothetical protein
MGSIQIESRAKLHSVIALIAGPLMGYWRLSAANTGQALLVYVSSDEKNGEEFRGSQFGTAADRKRARKAGANLYTLFFEKRHCTIESPLAIL